MKKYIGQHIFDYVASFRQNVGIGTDTPNRQLQVKKTTGTASIAITSSNTGTSQLELGGTSDNDIAGISYSSNTQKLFLKTNNTGQLYIDNSGKVGIGTDSPANALDVVTGNNVGVRFTADPSTQTWRDIKFVNAVQETQAASFDDHSHIYTTTTANGTNWPFTEYGALVIEGRDNTNSGIAFRTGNGSGQVTRLAIRESGNVGIGVTDPGSLLQVNSYTGSATDGAQGIYAGGLSIFTNSGTTDLFMGVKNASYANRGWSFKTTEVGVNSKLELVEHGLSGTRLTIVSGGNATFASDVTVSGNLTVSGTQTTINTTNLNVEDKNITINYSTGDSSSTADGAGITIQDAVDSSNDATILWDATDDRFDFSHDIQLPDGAGVRLGTDADALVTHSGSNMSIVNNTGQIFFTQNTDDGDIIFKCDDGSGSTTTYMQVDGSHSRVIFPNNIQAAFGSSSRFVIFHDGTDATMRETQGDLKIINTANDKDIIFQSDDGSGGVETYLTIDGSARTVNFGRHAFFPDGFEARFGDAYDLTMKHNGTNSSIINNVGDLQIINNTNDGDITFDTDDGSGNTTEYFRLDGGTETNIFTKPSTFNNTVVIGSQQLKFADNGKVRLGDSNDLEIYHNGTDSVIDNVSGGDLYISQKVADKDLIFRADDGTGGFTEYFRLDGSFGGGDGAGTRFTIFPDKSRIGLGNNADLRMNHDGTDSHIINLAGNLTLDQRADDKDIIFKSDDGSGGVTEYFRLDGSDTSVLFSETLKVADSKYIGLGNSFDFHLQHDGTNSKITNSTGDLYIINGADNKDIIFSSDDGSGGVTQYFRVDGGEEKVIFNKPVKFDFDVFTESNAELNLDAISTTGSGTVVKGGFLNPASEADMVHIPHIINDLAGFNRWSNGAIVTSGFYSTRSGSSGSYSYSNEIANDNAGWANAFDAHSSTAGSWYSDNGTDGVYTHGVDTPGTVELQWPNEITYSLVVGIVFGSNSFTATYVKIEAYKGDGAGGFAWQTLCEITNNTDQVILRKVNSNSGTGSATKRLKYTLGGSVNGSYFRIHSLYMANYRAGDNNLNNTGIDSTRGVNFLERYKDGFLHGHLRPGADDTYDLGSNSYKWKDGYFDGTVYTDGLNVDGNGEADRMTLNGTNFPQLFLIEGSGNSKTLQAGMSGDSAYFKKSDDTGSLIIRNSSNTNIALFSFATNNTTFGGDIIVGPKNNALVEVSESGGSTVKMLAGSVGRVGTYSNHNFIITQNSGDAITIDTSRNATFAGTITSSNLATKNVVLVHGSGGVVGNSGSNSSDSHTWTITHGMGSSRNYKVEVMLNSGNYDTIYPDITRPSDTTIVITFSAAVANSAYKALILKCE